MFINHLANCFLRSALLLLISHGSTVLALGALVLLFWCFGVWRLGTEVSACTTVGWARSSLLTLLGFGGWPFTAPREGLDVTHLSLSTHFPGFPGFAEKTSR